MLHSHRPLTAFVTTPPTVSSASRSDRLPADRELSRAHRVASDRLQPEDLNWLRKGFSAFLAGGGTLPLERCLRLPSNKRALQRARRDHWLRVAWLQMEAGSAWQRSKLLASEVQRFQAAKWPGLAGCNEAPADARPVDEALFEAFRAHERVPGTAMQLHNIATERVSR